MAYPLVRSNYQDYLSTVFDIDRDTLKSKEFTKKFRYNLLQSRISFEVGDHTNIMMVYGNYYMSDAEELQYNKKRCLRCLVANIPDFTYEEVQEMYDSDRLFQLSLLHDCKELIWFMDCVKDLPRFFNDLDVISRT